MSKAARATIALLLALALVSVGCGSGDAQAEGETRPFTDAQGNTVQLPVKPERVVALSELTLDSALTLDVRPVGTTAGRGQGTIAAYLMEHAEGIESVGILAQPSIEKVAALKPDLILTDGTATLDASVMDKLRRVAPTVYISTTGQNWREAFASTADALGRQDEGVEKLKEFDERVEEIKGKLGPNAGAEVSIVRWGGIGLPAVIKKELSAGRTLTALGLTRPEFQDEDGPGHSVPVNYEELELLDGDWMFFGALGAGGPSGGVTEGPADIESAREAIRYATETPGFTRLRAYTNGRVIPVDGSAWTSAGGYLAQLVVLDDVERHLATGE